MVDEVHALVGLASSVNTLAPGAVCSATKLLSVDPSVLSTERAEILLVSRSLVPTTMAFPTAPRPVSFARFFLGMFFRFPPMYVSSASTGPENSGLPLSNVLRMRCGQMPRRLLRDLQIAVQLHTAHAL